MAQADSEQTVDNEVQTGQEQELETTEVIGDKPAAEGGEGAPPEGEDDEVVVTLAGESPTPEEEEEQRAPEWVRELRKQNREKDRRLRELEQQLVAVRGTGQQPTAIVVGEKPSLEGCGYDAAKFEAELDSWKERKAQSENQQRQATEAVRKQQDAWNATLQDYAAEKTALKVKDYEEAEEVVRGIMSLTQQGVILDGVDKGRRAALIYALGKNPAKAKELAAISNPIKFAFATAKLLETQLKVTPRKSAPPPERRMTSTVAGAAAVDATSNKQLEKLREEAAKTGDLSKVIAFKRQQKAGRG